MKDDAVHVAFATYYEFDVLLSWNFKHMANIMKQTRINAFNDGEIGVIPAIRDSYGKENY